MSFGPRKNSGYDIAELLEQEQLGVGQCVPPGYSLNFPKQVIDEEYMTAQDMSNYHSITVLLKPQLDNGIRTGHGHHGCTYRSPEYWKLDRHIYRDLHMRLAGSTARKEP